MKLLRYLSLLSLALGFSSIAKETDYACSFVDLKGTLVAKADFENKNVGSIIIKYLNGSEYFTHDWTTHIGNDKKSLAVENGSNAVMVVVDGMYKTRFEYDSGKDSGYFWVNQSNKQDAWKLNCIIREA
ncbi:hypothetical protein [Alteromonas portus]|uniref:hypothetical protein n=1 Tax=Alteromonas portus TaxID=2565549 RepID=UPI003BF86647